jgi:hypothetical protein
VNWLEALGALTGVASQEVFHTKNIEVILEEKVTYCLHRKSLVG